MKNLCAVGLFFVSTHLGYAGSPTTEQIQISTSDHLRIRGVVTLPSGVVRGAVLIIQGSGNVGANGDVSNPMIGSGYHGADASLSTQIAERLAEVGIASLRYDKRGFEDPSQLSHQIFPYLVDDARSALATLRERFDSAKIGIVGFSEGALVGSMVAVSTPVDALFLLSLPARKIDDVLGYQFFTWPIELLKLNVDANQDGLLTSEEFTGSGATTLPFAGAPWQIADANADGVLSLVSELIPFYQGVYRQVLPLLDTDEYRDWYHSMQAIPSFASVASAIHSPVFLYHGMNDAQTRWSWVVEDSKYFSTPPTLRLFQGLGHCLAPMDGAIGEVKTSGPFDDAVLSALGTDVPSQL